MTNELILFQFRSHEVRTLMDNDGNPWFVAKDVCECFGLEYFHKALEKLRPTEKGLKKIQTPGGSQELSVINEPGLYRLIFRSNKPEAESFQDWVYYEVLPTIRKTGSYGFPLNQEAIREIVRDELKKLLTPSPPKQIPESTTNKAFYRFITHWFGIFGSKPLRVKTLHPIAKESGVFEILLAESQGSEYKRLGRWLTRNTGQAIADFIILKTKDTTTGKSAYRLQKQ